MIVYRVDRVTTNRITDKQIANKIGDMWDLSKELLKDHKGPIYCIYYNFRGDVDDDFDYTIGSSFKLEDRNPVKFDVDKYDYKVFEKNLVRDKGLIGAWEYICELEEKGQLDRAYGIDYEIFHPDGNIEIYISINK